MAHLSLPERLLEPIHTHGPITNLGRSQGIVECQDVLSEVEDDLYEGSLANVIQRGHPGEEALAGINGGLDVFGEESGGDGRTNSIIGEVMAVPNGQMTGAIGVGLETKPFMPSRFAWMLARVTLAPQLRIAWASM